MSGALVAGADSYLTAATAGVQRRGANSVAPIPRMIGHAHPPDPVVARSIDERYKVATGRLLSDRRVRASDALAMPELPWVNPGGPLSVLALLLARRAEVRAARLRPIL